MFSSTCYKTNGERLPEIAELMSGNAFAQTRWSLVQRLREHDAPRAARALEELCQIYWRPLYAYVLRSGRSHHEAEDLTQGFFATLLEKRAFETADAEKGRLRNYLLTGLKHYLVNDYHHHHRQKREGHYKVISLDGRGDLEVSTSTDSPDALYEKEWALVLLQEVLRTLEGEMTSRGQGLLFQKTQGALMGDDQGRSYRDIGRSLGLTESAIKVAIHRMRRRYRQLLHRQVADTLAPGIDPDDEIDHIIAALRG